MTKSTAELLELEQRRLKLKADLIMVADKLKIGYTIAHLDELMQQFTQAEVKRHKMTPEEAQRFMILWLLILALPVHRKLLMSLPLPAELTALLRTGLPLYKRRPRGKKRT